MSVVPHLDLVRQHEPLRDRIAERLADHVARAAFVGGASVSAFESEFADACGVPISVMPSGGETAGMLKAGSATTSRRVSNDDVIKFIPIEVCDRN